MTVRNIVFCLTLSGIVFFILLLSLLVVSGDSITVKFGTFAYWTSIFLSGWALTIALINIVLAENRRNTDMHNSVVDEFWFRKIFGELSIPKFIEEIGCQISNLEGKLNDTKLLDASKKISSLTRLFDPLDGVSGGRELMSEAYLILEEMEDRLLDMLEPEKEVNESNAKLALEEGMSKMLQLLSRYHLQLIGHNN